MDSCTMRAVFYIRVVMICLALASLTEGKRGRKLEETRSFDVKPSGQVAHQTVDLVRQLI